MTQKEHHSLVIQTKQKQKYNNLKKKEKKLPFFPKLYKDAIGIHSCVFGTLLSKQNIHNNICKIKLHLSILINKNNIIVIQYFTVF